MTIVIRRMCSCCAFLSLNLNLRTGSDVSSHRGQSSIVSGQHGLLLVSVCEYYVPSVCIHLPTSHSCTRKTFRVILSVSPSRLTVLSFITTSTLTMWSQLVTSSPPTSGQHGILVTLPTSPVLHPPISSSPTGSQRAHTGCRMSPSLESQCRKLWTSLC